MKHGLNVAMLSHPKHLRLSCNFGEMTGALSFVPCRQLYGIILFMLSIVPLIWLQLIAHPTISDEEPFIAPHEFMGEILIDPVKAYQFKAKHLRNDASGRIKEANKMSRHNFGDKMNTLSNQDGGRNNRVHPRVACFGVFDADTGETHSFKYAKRISIEESSCQLFGMIASNSSDAASSDLTTFSIPRQSDFARKRDPLPIESNEDENCALSDPSYQSITAAPSTCNDVHALGFDSSIFESQKLPLSHYVEIAYITSGGAKSVWNVTSIDGESKKEQFIMKTNKFTPFFKITYWEQNRRDALVTGATRKYFSSFAGGGDFLPPAKTSNVTSDLTHSWNHVLPMYHFCALASIVPYATAGTLVDYVRSYSDKHNGEIMDAADILSLALQAARGLYQAHLYLDGRATHVHNDITPSQFLLFSVPKSSSDTPTPKERFDHGINPDLPFLQINDFNQGRFLSRSLTNNETCPFRICPVRHRGNRYRSPEQYVDCAEQTDAIDVFSLGNVFFFLLSDGRDPHFSIRRFDLATKNGKLPQLPTIDDYVNSKLADGGEALFREKRTGHPAYRALKEVMIKCWAFNATDRPKSSEVVQMLEKNVYELNGMIGKTKPA